MSAAFMGAFLVTGFGVFFYSARRRWLLLKSGKSEDRFDQIEERIKRTLKFAFFQKKLPWYPLSGIAHVLIFWGFIILLFNSVILWGKAFDDDFSLFILNRGTWIGDIYFFLKDIFVVLVLLAALVALINRVFVRPSRLTQSSEANLILLIIIVMMVGELFWGAWEIRHEAAGGKVAFDVSLPAGSATAVILAGLDMGVMKFLGYAGYWSHAVLVLVFLNLLPYGKHFHVITSIPNVFLSNLKPGAPLLPDPAIEAEMNEEEGESEGDGDEEPEFGVGRVEQFTWKAMLDFYSCTECGRCTDNCPAAQTNKTLSPKKVLCDVRNNLYAREKEFISETKTESLEEESDGAVLVPGVVDPTAIWDCTTCRACDDQCPLLITHADKIIYMRRNLVLDRGEVPSELATALRGVETNQNPWNISRMDRGKWTEDLDVDVFDSDEHEYLFFAGCAASFDDRARKISQSMVRLLQKAGVKFGILGEDEPCCGDLARRAGNEFLFRMTADVVIEAFNDLGVKKIVTLCPHGYNIFKNEYPEFGGNWEVVHHSQLLVSLISEGRLKPDTSINQAVTYHDPCYLGRYNSEYSAPRSILASIPGLKLLEPERRDHLALCCGAGGAQYFCEESNEERISVKRTQQLLDTGAATIVTACPFCMTMISDGLKTKDLFDVKGQVDIAEILDIACGTASSRKLLREQTG